MPSRRQRPLLALPLLLRLLEPPHQSHQLVEGLVNVHPELGAALDVRRAEVLGKADDLVLVDLQQGGDELVLVNAAPNSFVAKVFALKIRLLLYLQV